MDFFPYQRFSVEFLMVLALALLSIVTSQGISDDSAGNHEAGLHQTGDGGGLLGVDGSAGKGQRGILEPDADAAEGEGRRVKYEGTGGPGKDSSFLLPSGYDKLVIPKLNDTFINVQVYISIRSITGVDEKEGVLEMDVEIGIAWVDWEIWRHLLEDDAIRVQLRSAPDRYVMDAAFLASIWKPDIFIDQLVSVSASYLLSKQFSVYFYVRSADASRTMATIVTHSRQTLRARCEMDFTFYPADTQKCALHLRSYKFNDHELLLTWSRPPRNQSVFLDQMADPNYDFQVSDVEPGGELAEVVTNEKHPCCRPESKSTLMFTIQVRRNLTYHLVQTFLPSVLLIMITWLCFLLPQDMVEARIGISMTTLLTIIAMFGAVRQQAPEVSYTMAIDVWMVFCIFLIFLALLLFTVMYWIRRKYVKKPEDQEAEAGAGTGTIAMETTTTDGNCHGEGPAPLHRRRSKILRYARHVTQMKRGAFIFFAVIFALFLLVFGFVLLFGSGYSSWNPSPKYNMVDGEGSGGASANPERIFRIDGLPLGQARGSESGDKAGTAPATPGMMENLVALRARACARQKERNPADMCDVTIRSDKRSKVGSTKQ